jgi:hypothetical protein
MLSDLHRYRNLSYLKVNRLTLRLVDVSENHHVRGLPFVRVRLFSTSIDFT